MTELSLHSSVTLFSTVFQGALRAFWTASPILTSCYDTCLPQSWWNHQHSEHTEIKAESALGFLHAIVATGSQEISCQTLKLYLETMMAKYSSMRHVIMEKTNTFLSNVQCRLFPSENSSESRNSYQQLALRDSMHFPLWFMVVCLSLSFWHEGTLKPMTSIPISAINSTLPCI